MKIRGTLTTAVEHVTGTFDIHDDAHGDEITKRATSESMVYFNVSYQNREYSVTWDIVVEKQCN